MGEPNERLEPCGDRLVGISDLAPDGETLAEVTSALWEIAPVRIVGVETKCLRDVGPPSGIKSASHRSLPGCAFLDHRRA